LTGTQAGTQAGLFDQANQSGVELAGVCPLACMDYCAGITNAIASALFGVQAMFHEYSGGGVVQERKGSYEKVDDTLCILTGVSFANGKAVSVVKSAVS
jgi:hypothetical protein